MAIPVSTAIGKGSLPTLFRLGKLLLPMRIARIPVASAPARLSLILLFVACPAAFSAQVPSEPAAALVRRTVANELKAEPCSFMFRARKQTPRGSQTHVYVQSKDATAGILVAVNDRPLEAAQHQAEEARLDYLAHNPSELARKQKQEKDDADRINRIVRAMPDAFTYEYDGVEQGGAGVGRTGEELLRLKFRPNPKYDPPTRVEQVLTGMRGILLVDANQHRIAKIDGTLYKDVSFGWGFFGHLDKGGKFHVEQGEVAENAWEITRMSLKFTGKILLFKSLVINSDEVFSDFQQVPNSLSFAEAVALLRKHEVAPVSGAHNAGK